MKKALALFCCISILSGVLFSCTHTGGAEENPELLVKLIYDRDNIMGEENFSHYKTIKKIEEISSNNIEFTTVINNTPDFKGYNGVVMKYTYDGELVSYKAGDIYIYENKGNVLAVKATEVSNSLTEKTLTYSNLEGSQLYYKLKLNTENKEILSFEKIDYFPLETLGFDKDSKTVLNSFSKQVECDDLSWSDCMDCTVSDCGSRWWCVGLLVVAGPETLVGMAVSCTMDL